MTKRATYRPWVLLSVGCLFAAFTLSACALRTTARKTDSQKKTADSAQDDASAASGVEVEEAKIQGSEFQSLADLQNVQFDYDMYSLSEQARVILRNNATYLKAHPDLEVLVAGHCDERGTVQYNLALGQKRAKETRDYYIRIGVPGKSIATISYGEERPLCQESSEECWSQNRRGETRIRARTASNHKPKYTP